MQLYFKAIKKTFVRLQNLNCSLAKSEPGILKCLQPLFQCALANVLIKALYHTIHDIYE